MTHTGTLKTENEYSQSTSSMNTINAILLDDNELDQRHVARMVKRAEMPVKCVFANDAEAFGEALDKQVFDIALLDYHLVGSNGFDAVRQLRLHGSNRMTPVIMVSSDAPTELVVSAMRSGCSGYLPKDNLTAETLGNSINLALQDLANRQFSGFTALDLKRTTQKILDGVHKVSEAELRDATNRISRATNFLRQCQSGGYQADIETFNILERECGRIRRFLDDLENHCSTWSNNTSLHCQTGALN